MIQALVIGDVIDDILVTPKDVVRFDTDTPASIRQQPGGSAANFACWLGSTGVSVEFVGRVGQGDALKHSAPLESFGVKASLQLDGELATGSIVVMVQGESRSFLTDRGANQRLDLNAITEFPAVTYLSGYTLFGSFPQEQFRSLIERAKAAGSMVVLDPGSAGFIADFGVKKFLDLVAGVDLITPSLEEGKLLTGEDRADVIAQALNTRFEKVALTLGAQGVEVCESGKSLRVEAIPADTVDATGAGDAFAAGLVAGILAGESLEVAARRGVKLGAIAVTIPGGRPLAKSSR